MDYSGRLDRLRARLRQERADTFVVSHLPNIRYLTGFTGSNALLVVTPARVVFYSDSRYRQQAAEEVVGARVVIPPKGQLLAAAAKALARSRRVALEAAHLSWADLLRWHALAGKSRRYLAAHGWVERLRAVKEPAEIAAIRAALDLAAAVLPPVLESVRPGMTERELAARLEFALRQAGGAGTAFDTIVASGPRAAIVHGRAADKPLRAGELVIVDYGVWRGDYCSDMTRTFAVGRAPRKARQIHRAVLEAQQAAIAACGPGAACRRVDAAARKVLAAHGLGEYFVHSTGHGLGLEVHEAPRLAAASADRLEAGHVVTIEPGVYLPGWGGARIEDVVAITPRGAEVLSSSPRELLEVGS